ncbi:hypothetical protein CAPTEDRAFT_188739 [Capitella teleta]|uniref:Uncharacterized protein n=1 Tax=Capitella teleta TaxID=283909 RepID=R7TC02_CAPTE|nr:hypothetical protein CAPTEDRAFT_188739 [Capitella teleta]|eukprot:ELT89022.1 hypothetical protein CAPTEDRAFT_188739 [Capitella teleta]
MAGRVSSHRSQPPMETVKDEQEGDANGYMRVLMRPIQEHSRYKALLDWITQAHSQLTSQQLIWAYGAGGVSVMVLVYQLVMRDLGFLFHRFCALLIPIFSIICSFYWVALYFRKSWSTTSIYVLFCACFAGEFLTQCICDTERDNYISQPLLSFGVLLGVSGASLFSTLETVHSTGIIAFISFIRFLACTMLTDLPQVLRPFLAYFSGIVGVIFAKYMETVFKAPVSNPITSDGKIPVIKRRRSSSSNVHNFSTHRCSLMAFNNISYITTHEYYITLTFFHAVKSLRWVLMSLIVHLDTFQLGQRFLMFLLPAVCEGFNGLVRSREGMLDKFPGANIPGTNTGVFLRTSLSPIERLRFLGVPLLCAKTKIMFCSEVSTTLLYVPDYR